MSNKDFKRHYAYEALVGMAALALLLLVCRLWPILLLVILGIFIALIRLLFLSAEKVQILEPEAVPVQTDPKETPADLDTLLFDAIQRRVTELVLEVHPQARWVWATPKAKDVLMNDGDVYILLNNAGGYRRAKVVVRNMKVCNLEFPAMKPEMVSLPSETEPAQSSGSSDEKSTQETEEKEPDSESTEAEQNQNMPKKKPKNFDLLAFDWVDTHMEDLNQRFNEMLARHQSFLLLSKDELPEEDSWSAIKKELERNGIENCTLEKDGIKIHLKMKNSRKD